jgi:FMN-dependent NADH-azoreductase
MNVLHILANPKPIEESASKQLAAAFFAKLAEVNPDVNVENVDLCLNPPPFFSYDLYRYLWYPIFQPGYQPTDAEKAAAEYCRQQCELFRDTDIVVMTMPMWNFSVPGIVKAWIDQVISPNETFTMSPEGVKPLHRVKRIIVLVASGGAYKEGDPRDALTPEIRAAFGFINIDDIAVAWADGQNSFFFTDADDRKKTAMEVAQELAEEVAALT